MDGNHPRHATRPGGTGGPQPTVTTEREQRLRALAESSGDMLALYDVDGGYLEVSPACRELFGWEPRELLGTSSYDYFHPDDLALIADTHHEVLVTDRVGPITYRLRCADGTYRWVEVIGSNVRDPDTGEVTAIQCTTRDVQARHAAEVALRDSEERLRTLLRYAPIGHALLGPDRVIRDVGDALTGILQRERSALIGASLGSVTAPEDLDNDRTLLDELLSGHRSHYHVRKRYLRPDGTSVPCELHVSLVRDARGDPLTLVAQIVDRSHEVVADAALRAANTALARSNEELERFAAVASHDLRSPLGTTRGLLELLGRRLELPPGSLEEDLLRRASAQLVRLSDTVDGLLELGRITGSALHSEEIATAELLAEVLESLSGDPDLIAGSVRLTSHAWIVGDRRLLRDLLQNLLSNALRSAADDRAVSVEVAAERTDERWRVLVTDDGDGIPLRLRDQLFTPYAHLDRRAHQPGHGLGLATCSRIVERHGGRIEVEHRQPGTRVVVEIPLRPPPSTG